MFRGRELAHVGLGQKVLERLLESVKDICQVERAPRMEGRNMTMILVPKPQDRSVNKQASPDK